MNKNQFESAFPIVEFNPIMGSRVDPGMSLRDWFAGHALMGILASATFEYLEDKNKAKLAYELADHMIDARKKDGAI